MTKNSKLTNKKIEALKPLLFPEISLNLARQASRRKRKELGQEPPKGYTLNDALKLWCKRYLR
jgi:hypothetical protein